MQERMTAKIEKDRAKREEVEERHQQKKRRIQARITECWAKLPDTRKRMIEVEQEKERRLVLKEAKEELGI